MRIWFISRHPGARDWARQQDLAVTHWRDHLDVEEVMPGDVVVGTLPIHLAVAVCQRGAEYWHLTIALPAQRRGAELSATELHQLDARLVRYDLAACRELEPDERGLRGRMG